MKVTTNYALDEEDYLCHRLFYASKSEQYIKQRRKNLFLWPGIFLFLTFLTFLDDRAFSFYYFLIAAVLFPILVPIYERFRYKKHYLKYIRETYKDSFGKTAEFVFTNETIEAKDQTGINSSVPISQISEISEIEKYYFLHLQSLGQSFIIPKEKIQNLPEVANAIKEITEKFNIKYNVELNWKWK